MHKQVLTVYQVNKYIKEILSNDIILSDLFIEGEISNFKQHKSGHIYFKLKDNNSAINCVKFAGGTSELKFYPEDGMKVIVYGRIGIYEKTGQYQIYVDIMEPVGKGALFIAFEQLKDKLQKEGLFSSTHKKELPKDPKTIALVTSPTGAAVQDMIKIATRRNPSISIIVIPVLVQGENAAESISKGINLVNLWGKADIIIIGRGGGSAEDLWAFNEEIVARAVFNSKIPIISAVGHETDFTISDFVADVRASTPSSAIEICVPKLQDKIDNVYYLLEKLNTNINSKLNYNKTKLENLCLSKSFEDPFKIIEDKKNDLSVIKQNLDRDITVNFEKNYIKLQSLINNLRNMAPLNVLNRGYSILYKNDDIISSVKKISVGDNVNIHFKDGYIKVHVDDIKEEVLLWQEDLKN